MARNSGTACFLVFPLIGAVALKITSRRYHFPPGSLVGVFLVSVSAFLVIAAWAILYLKGPNGGWSVGEIVVSTASFFLCYGAAACIGWWSGRSIRQQNA